jgi:transposase
METNKRIRGGDISEREKYGFVCMTLWHEEPPKKMSKIEICEMFGIGESTGRKIIKEYKESVEEGELAPDFSMNRVGNCGRHSELTETMKKRLLYINKKSKGELTLRAFAVEYEKKYDEEINHSTLGRYIEEMGFKTIRSYLKPALSPEQKLARLDFILQKKDLGYKFKLELLVIHVDEKWFFLTKDKKRIRIHPDDEPFDARRVQHKSHIGKIMFLSAIGVPHRSPNGEFFNGKVGIWDLTEQVAAINNSKNRPAGTLVTTPYNVNSQTYYDLMVGTGGVLQTIRKNFSWLKGKPIIIQHDGATPHNGEGNDVLLDDAGQEYGWNIRFVTQPAQSPDLNKNDLCFFYSLQQQSARYRQSHADLDDLIKAVKKAYADYSIDQLERVHALQVEIYRQILNDGGGNGYKLPHSGITQRQEGGFDAWDLEMPKDLIKRAKEERNRWAEE